jgi:hypothetical protein
VEGSCVLQPLPRASCAPVRGTLERFLAV